MLIYPMSEKLKIKKKKKKKKRYIKTSSRQKS